MTELQIASAVKNYVTSGEGVTFSNLDLEQIRDEVDTLRMRIVQELSANRALIAEAYFQVLEGAQVTTTIVTSGAFKGWTEITIPTIFTNPKGKPEISYIGPESESLPYRVVTGNQYNYIKSERFTQDYPIAVVDAKSIKLSKAPKKIIVKALFEDPSALEIYGAYDHENDQYPCPQGDIDSIIGKTAESYIRTSRLKVIQPNSQVDLSNSKG
jgi:hypothetical protein